MFRESKQRQKKIPKRSFFVKYSIQTEKEVNYCWKEDSSNTFTSMNKTSTQQYFHIQGVREELIRDSIRFLFDDENLYEPKKNQKKTQNFDTEF